MSLSVCNYFDENYKVSLNTRITILIKMQLIVQCKVKCSAITEHYYEPLCAKG